MKLKYSGLNQNEFFEIDVDDEKAISVAKEIQKNKWRTKRNRIFVNLDIEFIKALETDNKEEISQIAGIKNELRNVTEIEMPKTVEEIMEFWPDILKD